MERADLSLNGVQVFTATRQRERDSLGETATRWLKEHTNVEIVDWVVTQSSDNEYHCLSITLFYHERS
jgi:hypothetical protein